MDFRTFEESLSQAEPPGDLPMPLRALWHQEVGDWDEAHRLVQSERTQASAWVHALLHRIRGESGNAAYWYGVAGRMYCASSLSSEWREIANQLLRIAAEPALEMDH